jgi:hypothetical protein
VIIACIDTADDLEDEFPEAPIEYQVKAGYFSGIL